MGSGQFFFFANNIFKDGTAGTERENMRRRENEAQDPQYAREPRSERAVVWKGGDWTPSGWMLWERWSKERHIYQQRGGRKRLRKASISNGDFEVTETMVVITNIIVYVLYVRHRIPIQPHFT